MRWRRGTINAVLAVTLVRPVARRLIAKARRRAREHPASALMIPAQELLETALLAELSASEAGLEPMPDETRDELADRHMVRTVLLVGALAVALAAAALAIATVVRRRRSHTPEPETDANDWVAVPVEVPAEESGEAIVSEAPIDERSTPQRSGVGGSRGDG